MAKASTTKIHNQILHIVRTPMFKQRVVDSKKHYQRHDKHRHKEGL